MKPHKLNCEAFFCELVKYVNVILKYQKSMGSNF